MSLLSLVKMSVWIVSVHRCTTATAVMDPCWAGNARTLETGPLAPNPTSPHPRESPHLPLLSPNVSNGWDWVRLKLQDRNTTQVPHEGNRNPANLSHHHCTSAGVWSQEQNWDSIRGTTRWHVAVSTARTNGIFALFFSSTPLLYLKGG